MKNQDFAPSETEPFFHDLILYDKAYFDCVNSDKDVEECLKYLFEKVNFLKEANYKEITEKLMKRPELEGEINEESVYSVAFRYKDSFYVRANGLLKFYGKDLRLRVSPMQSKTIYTKAIKSMFYQPYLGLYKGVIFFPSYWKKGIVEIEEGKYPAVYYELSDYFRIEFIHGTRNNVEELQVFTPMKQIYRKIDKLRSQKGVRTVETSLGGAKLGYDVVEIGDGEKAYFLPLWWKIGDRKFKFRYYVRITSYLDIDYRSKVFTYSTYFLQKDPAGIVRNLRPFSPYSYMIAYAKKMGWLK